MTEYQVTLFRRKVANLCVAAGPLAAVAAVLAATDGLSPKVRMYAGIVSGVLAALTAWALKNVQSSRDIQADAVTKD